MVHKNAEAKTASAAKVAVVGVRGYSGLELARILLKHPEANLVAGFATDTAFKLSDYMPEQSAASVPVLSMKELEAVACDLNTVFLATPAEVSLELAPKLLTKGVNVIDLSGAFRLRAEAYPKWYGFEHTAAALLSKAHFGLSPFAGPAASGGKATLVSNPGCYATAVLMALIPLMKEKLIAPESLVIDAKSGTSGAGRKASEGMLFTEVEGECLPYKVAKHQHFPEICRYAETFAGTAPGSFDPMLTTSLINVRRGIIAGLYARLKPGAGAKQVQAAYEKSFSGYPLVRFGEDTSLSLKRVVGSARTHINYKVDGDKLYVFSLIDNLLKGAASQAVENFNALNDLPVATALTDMEGLL